MQSWTFYPAFVGTAISVVGWTIFAFRNHSHDTPRTLSELSAEVPNGLRYNRAVLWVCDLMFAITMFFFVVPRISTAIVVGVGFALTIMCEALIGVWPAQRGKSTIHDALASLMAVGMLTSAYASASALSGTYAATELWLSLTMTLLAIFTLIDRGRYIFYELPFIFLAHFTVLVAALGLR